MPLDAANQTLMDLLAQVSPAPLETLSAPEARAAYEGSERCRPARAPRWPPSTSASWPACRASS